MNEAELFEILPNQTGLRSRIRNALKLLDCSEPENDVDQVVLQQVQLEPVHVEAVLNFQPEDGESAQTQNQFVPTKTGANVFGQVKIWPSVYSLPTFGPILTHNFAAPLNAENRKKAAFILFQQLYEYFV